MRRIDKRAGRCLRQNPDDPGNRHDDADLGLVPLPHRQQIDGKVWPEATPNIGKEEIQRIKSAAGADRRCPKDG